ncbi:MAG TPA: NYN domain-containing protein [Dehalococcoidia bacterium]|nr:NYN domain-containing protein [Dehalococcoidia bacterium]
MNGAESAPDAALLIDWENIKFSLQQRNIRLNVSAIRDKAETYGRVVVARAYADWQDGYHGGDPSNLYAAGIEPIYVPTRSYREDDGATKVKNSVDVKLTADCIELCHRYESIDVFVLVTGDQDFLHVVNTLRPYGKHVVIFGVSWTTSARLAERVDAVVYYDREIEPIVESSEREVAAQPLPSDILAFESVAGTLVHDGHVAEDLKSDLIGVLQAITQVVSDYRSARQPLLLSTLGMELGKRVAPQTFSMVVKGRLKQLSQELQSAGLLRVVTQGLVDWLYLPDESIPEDVSATESAGDGLERLLSTHYVDMPRESRAQIIRAIRTFRAQPGIAYLTFNTICDAVSRTPIGVELSGDVRRLVSGMVESGVLDKDDEPQVGFDPTTGNQYTFPSFRLNMQHPLLKDCLD